MHVSKASDGRHSINDKSNIIRATAYKSDELCTDGLDDTESFLMSIWELLLCVIRIILYNVPGQDRAVSVLETLQLRAKTTVNL